MVQRQQQVTPEIANTTPPSMAAMMVRPVLTKVICLPAPVVLFTVAVHVHVYIYGGTQDVIIAFADIMILFYLQMLTSCSNCYTLYTGSTCVAATHGVF